MIFESLNAHNSVGKTEQRLTSISRAARQGTAADTGIPVSGYVPVYVVQKQRAKAQLPIYLDTGMCRDACIMGA